MALRPDNITSNPSAFWPFVFVDFGFGGVSAILLALGEWKLAAIVIALGIPPNLYFAFPAFFVPSYAVKKTSFRSYAETVWLRNAGLLIFIITAYHVVAAVDPERFQAVAWGTVGGRLAAGVYWVIVAMSKPVPAESPTSG